LRNGQDVQPRDIKSILTNSEWTEYNNAWEIEKTNRNLSPPKALISYIEKKKQVSLAFARCEKYRNQSVLSKKDFILKELYLNADSQKDMLLEYLAEQISVNKELTAWLIIDEQYESIEHMISLNILPQVITSRAIKSINRSPFGVQRKRELKIQIIEQAILNITDKEDLIEPSKFEFKKSRSNKDFSGFKV
jgi:hypothetical protein